MLAISYYTQADKKGRHVRHLRGQIRAATIQSAGLAESLVAALQASLCELVLITEGDSDMFLSAQMWCLLEET